MPKKSQGNIRDFIPESSRIDAPSKLVLMPGERLLGNHDDFFVTNKRIIKHKQDILGHKTIDYSFNHIKGLNEVNRRPLLTSFLCIGIVFLFIGFSSTLFFVLGAVIIVIAFWYKVSELEVHHIDGDKLLIPRIEGENAKALIKILRAQVYDKK